jgi:hypothetical protein
MKLVPRLISIIFVLISINAFADTISHFLNTNVSMGPNSGEGDNVGVLLSGQGVSIFALGGTPTGWFDDDIFYRPGTSGWLGPATIFWDSGALQIGSQLYSFYQFDLGSITINFPFVTFPSNGKDFSVSIPFVWEFDGTILGNCPTSGCGFELVSKPGTLTLSFVYNADTNAYFASGASFTTVPEPGTIEFMAIGIAAMAWLRFWFSASIGSLSRALVGGFK